MSSERVGQYIIEIKLNQIFSAIQGPVSSKLGG